MTRDDKISIEQTNEELLMLLDKYDWFYDSVIESKTAICVYVNHLDGDVQGAVPMKLYGYQVKLGMSAHLTCGEKYNTPIVMFEGE